MASGVFSWSQTAASNNVADTTINLREGQAPSTLNDSIRAMMAAIAKFRDDIGGNLLTTGTSTAYVLTSNQSFAALADGIYVTCRINVASEATPTLNVDSLGAKAIQSVSGTAIPTGAKSSHRSRAASALRSTSPARAGSADTAVCLCFKDLLTDFHRACNRSIALITLSAQRDTRAVWIAAILLFQWLLDCSQIHR